MSTKHVKVISRCIDEINNILVHINIDHEIELITNEESNVRIIKPVLNALLNNNVINESILES